VKRPHGKGSRREPVTEDDEIWLHAAATVEPLKRRASRVHPALKDAEPEATTKARGKPKSRSDVEVPRSEKLAANPAVARSKAKPSPPPALAEFDRKSVRKIRGGRTEIEARIDLHGLHQAEAYNVLRAFLARCHGRGLRFVLVITGKGKPVEADDAYMPAREQDRGVLKRNVPRWLEEPDIRSIVVSYTTAAIRHGGEGALYVHLRSKACA
jgi:DNA-nicking Smr family endonuclease